MGVQAALDMGFRLWIYDEKGYPSGSAGGLVLRNYRELEAMGIKDDNGHFFVSPLYEWTHPSRSFGEKRRYINLLNSEAVGRFIELTHLRYAEIMPNELFEPVEAFFTDEPSMMSVVFGELESLGDDVPVLDVPDPNVPLLPSIPYSDELEKELASQNGILLADIVPQLFAYQLEPSELKCVYWDAVSRVYEKAYAAQLADACSRMGKKLTGHVFFEEKPFENMIFHANPFKVLKHFHLPGIDQLSSQLSNISVYAHKLAFSCAYLSGRKGIMSETSDFDEYRLGDRKAASPGEMLSTLSMQFLLGVRDFALYYDFRVRKTEDYRWVNERICRLCELAQDFDYSAEAALYCPFETFWSGYVPTRSAFNDVIFDQPVFVQKTEEAVLALCDALFEKNIQFVLCDSSSLQDLIQIGVRHVFIPWCTVVAQELVDAAQDGKVILYGHLPDYVYGQGTLKKLTGLTVEETACFVMKKRPFTFAQGIHIAEYSGHHYFVFNLSTYKQKVIPHLPVSLFMMRENRHDHVSPGCEIKIQPGDSFWAVCESEER